MRAQSVPVTWIALPAVADPLLQNLNVPADAPTRGMWSASMAWPLNAIHSVLLSDGRVLTFGTPFGNPATQDGRYSDIWNPAMGFTNAAHITSVVPDPVNSFCGTSGWLQDGTLLVAGGNGNGGKSTGVFSTTTYTTANSSTLAAERWYATMLPLPDGRQIMIGGTVPYGSPVTSQTPEVLENGAWRSLFGAGSTPIFGVRDLGNYKEANPWYYPRTWVAPDGSLFGITSSIMFKMLPNDNNGSGSVTQIGTFKTPQDASGATTPNVGFTSSAVMFAPGRILQVGGNGITDNNPNLASNLATVFDINGANPIVTETAAMTNRRHWSNATVLPDGQVVVTGGTTIGWQPADAVHPAEIWNPTTGTWTVGASNVETRTYHSSAILLPNGTVFTGGGGAPGAVNNLNAEIYYPPNLFTTVNGVAQLAARPVLLGISSLQGAYAGSVAVEMADAGTVSQVALIGLGSTTHSFNNGQRRVPLQFTQSGTRLNMTMPGNANLAPPGYYMVFAVNTNGVPSRGTIIALGGVQPPNLPGGSTLPSTSSSCSAEGGNCVLPTGATASVYYGANGTYAIRTGLTGTIACNNNTFGDPLPGTVKSCAYVLDAATVTLPAVNAPSILAGGTVSYAPTISLTGATFSWSFGDGSANTAASTSPNTTHTFTAAGIYSVSLTARLSDGSITQSNFLQVVGTPATSGQPTRSSSLALETRSGASTRLWVANPDTNTVGVIDTASNTKVAEIAVGQSPRSVAIAPDGRVWVTSKDAATISILSPSTLAVVQTVTLPFASRPHGMAFVPGGGSALVVLEATGQVLKLDATSGKTLATLSVGDNPRHVSVSADGATALVSRFITAPLPGEGTAAIDTSKAGAEVLAINVGAMTLSSDVVLRHSDKVDAEAQGAGVPNYLGAAAISPDGKSAWVPSKQDNIKRGTLRSGQNLDFQNTVRAITSRLDMTALAEDYPRRVDLDNSSLASAAAYHPNGAYLFIALETSQQVAVVNAMGGGELFRFNSGRAPQGLVVSADGKTLYVQNFMDRSVSIVDLTPLVTQGLKQVGGTVTVSTITNETLNPTVLRGKQLFYDARDTRLARDGYMSCAACHNDGGHDGRTWDLTGLGEGLRNTITLKGHAGMGQGLLHWSGNFDEVQDFEKQIRDLAGGSGLMADAAYNTGTRSQPLGDPKAGISADLDALAAYVTSLSANEPSPYRPAAGTLTTAAAAGKTVFVNAACASCHGGTDFTNSALTGGMRSVGTIKAVSGNRLGAPLTGLDVPTLRGVWATAPYLHDGSAATLAAAVQAHAKSAVTGNDLTNLVAYLQQIDGAEAAPAAPLPDGVYRIVAQHSNQALDIQGVSAANGALATQWPWVAGDNQRWKLTNLGNGDYTVTAQHSGQRLEVSNASTADNGRVQQWPANNCTCQIWHIQSLGDGTFELINKNSGKVLDVSGVSQTAGAAVIQWTWLNGANQHWRIEPVSPNNIAAGTYSLTAVHSGKVLDVNAASPAAGANVQQWTWVGGANQKWTVTAMADGFFELAPSHAPAMRLEVAGGALGDGGNVQQGLASGSAAQRWGFEVQADGSYRLINRNSGEVLDVSGVSKADGANVWQWTWGSGANQMWKLTAQ